MNLIRSESLPYIRKQPILPYAVLVFVLAVPKIVLFSIGGGSIRPDDLLLFGCALAIIPRLKLRSLGRLDRAVFLWVFVQLFAALYSASTGRVGLVSGILFAVRPLEYWIISRLIVGRQKYRSLLATLAVANAAAAIGQRLHLFPSFSNFSVDRASGLLNGPYELAAFSAGIFFFMWSQRHRVGMLAAASCIWLSLSRSTLIVTLLVVVVGAIAPRLWERHRRIAGANRPLVLGLALGAAVLLVVGVGPLAQLRDRLNFSVAPTVQFADQLAQTAPSFRSAAEYQRIAYGQIGFINDVPQGVDPSGVVRFYRWALLLRSVANQPDTLLLGLGPSFAGPSVDGQYIRALAEGGLIGLGAFLLFVGRSLRTGSPYLRKYALVLAGTALFIDIGVAYKPMMLYWTLYGISSLQRPIQPDRPLIGASESSPPPRRTRSMPGWPTCG